MKRFRFRPTYSNVVATLALFFALAGGAWAATQLPKESVGTTQLAKGAVTPAKLSDQAKKGFTGARGEAGPQGALGPRGNEGQRGESGAAGATGAQGIRGATGATGATGSRGEPGEVGMRGERGLTGQTGATGPQGDKGDTGATGAKGEEGERGPRGERGVQGEPGERGEKGEPGKPGEKGEKGATGPSDAYFDVSEPQAVPVGHESSVPLEVKGLPAGEYVLQAALTVEGVTAPAVAECRFMGAGSGITIGAGEPFSTNITPSDHASLAGLATAVVVTEPAAVSVVCEAAGEGTSFVIPAETGHLTVTKVGALHPPTP